MEDTGCRFENQPRKNGRNMPKKAEHVRPDEDDEYLYQL
jgi:hypothetical protein